jgi:hypothetical protein
MLVVACPSMLYVVLVYRVIPSVHNLSLFCVYLQKTDSLSKLYEMDDSPDRRAWLDKLLTFMEERRTPITTCPTISKNPLDLFRLYVYVKDRGGFMEVRPTCFYKQTKIKKKIKDDIYFQIVVFCW